MDEMLVVVGLTKSFGRLKAVDNVSFTVSKGETFGLLGHNGAGKTTTIECILGVKQPDAGTVRLLGMHPAKNRKQLFEKVGVQFQEMHYQDKISVAELCEVTHCLYQNPYPWRDLLAIFRLQDKQRSMVAELSGGERQRLSVLLALIPNPELVFLDELTSGLDTKARRDVWKYLGELKGCGMTIVLTSHYMDEVENMCDRICILRKGRIAVLDTIEAAVKNSPYKTLEEAYLWYSGEEVDVHESFLGTL